MNNPNEIIIPIPVHPDEKHLPLSTIRLKLSRGIVETTFPVQGTKTIDNMSAILEVWKPNLVVDDPEPIYDGPEQ